MNPTQKWVEVAIGNFLTYGSRCECQTPILRFMDFQAHHLGKGGAFITHWMLCCSVIRRVWWCPTLLPSLLLFKFPRTSVFDMMKESVLRFVMVPVEFQLEATTALRIISCPWYAWAGHDACRIGQAGICKMGSHSRVSNGNINSCIKGSIIEKLPSCGVLKNTTPHSHLPHITHISLTSLASLTSHKASHSHSHLTHITHTTYITHIACQFTHPSHHMSHHTSHIKHMSQHAWLTSLASHITSHSHQTHVTITSFTSLLTSHSHHSPYSQKSHQTHMTRHSHLTFRGSRSICAICGRASIRWCL